MREPYIFNYRGTSSPRFRVYENLTTEITQVSIGQ